MQSERTWVAAWAVIVSGLSVVACQADANVAVGETGSSLSETGGETGDGDGDGDGAPGDGDGDGDGAPGDGDGDGDGDGALDPNEQIPPPDEEGCHAIYAQDLLPSFELTIHPLVWEQLQYEWNNGTALEDMNIDPKTYHPLQEFKYGDIVIYDAEIRLRGNATFWDPLPGDKMQFQIGFHRNDPDGHFLGLKRLALDAATFNRHMLRDRLSLAILRDAGVPAPCANNARVYVNGEYYGAFTNIEKLDEVFLQRNFADPSGDLWKRANWELKTNLDTATEDRLDQLEDAVTPEELDAILDIGAALRELAVEAVIPDSDGAWAGGLNYYLYDDPERGKFVLLPWDLDNTLERFDDPPDGEYPENPDPYVWEKSNTHGRPIYETALQDPQWFAYYIDTIDEVLHQAYVPETLHERIDTWTAQIEDAVIEDTNKPYDNDKYYENVEKLHAYVDARYAFVDAWLSCWQNGGIDDGTGHCMMP